MPPRIPYYPDAFAAWNAISSFGSIVSVAATVLFGYIIYDILGYGKPVDANPWAVPAFFAEEHMKEAMYAEHTAAISFTEDDLLPGTTEHNRPLYVTGMCEGIRINRILIDPGSSVNLMPMKTPRNLSLSIKHLSTEKIPIQGFYQNSQKALGAITLPISVGRFKTQAKFYIINIETSYKALLG